MIGRMPLSEHEQRILRQIEQELASDPRSPTAPSRIPRRRLMWLVLCLVVGLALTVAGLAVSFWLAFAAFVGVLIVGRHARAGAAAGQPRQARRTCRSTPGSRAAAASGAATRLTTRARALTPVGEVPRRACCGCVSVSVAIRSDLCRPQLAVAAERRRRLGASIERPGSGELDAVDDRGQRRHRTRRHRELVGGGRRPFAWRSSTGVPATPARAAAGRPAARRR